MMLGARRRWCGAWAVLGTVVVLCGAGCEATPLPTPPSARPSAMQLIEDQADRVVLAGEAGAIQPGGLRLRVTGPASALERDVDEDGSFVASLRGRRDDVYWLELVELDPARDTFLAAVTGGPGTTVVRADEGADADGDDSPDAVDCAPDDPATGGRLCNADAAECAPLPEACNGLDDDCDGLADDEQACACTGDSDCGAERICVGDACVVRPENDPAGDPVACNADDVCEQSEAGTVCELGFCVAPAACSADGRCDDGRTCIDDRCL